MKLQSDLFLIDDLMVENALRCHMTMKPQMQLTITDELPNSSKFPAPLRCRRLVWSASDNFRGIGENRTYAMRCK